jgi:hypothetical protein
MNNPGQPIDDAEAIRTLLETLRKLPADERAGVLKYVQEKLGVAVTVPNPPGPGGGGGPSGRSDMRTFVETKKPNNDVQFAATVAYFHAFETPPVARKTEITATDLTDATRLANWPRLKKSLQTLHNANKLGYLDKGSTRGAFKINTVGENLVAMALPTAAGAAPPPRKRNKKTAKPK